MDFEPQFKSWLLPRGLARIQGIIGYPLILEYLNSFLIEWVYDKFKMIQIYDNHFRIIDPPRCDQDI